MAKLPDPVPAAGLRCTTLPTVDQSITARAAALLVMTRRPGFERLTPADQAKMLNRYAWYILSGTFVENAPTVY